MDNLKTDDSKCWKTLSSEYLFRRPWLTARRDTVELPDGRVNDEFYVLDTLRGSTSSLLRPTADT